MFVNIWTILLTITSDQIVHDNFGHHLCGIVFWVILIEIHYGKKQKVKSLYTCKLVLTSTILTIDFRLRAHTHTRTSITADKQQCYVKNAATQKSLSCIKRKCVCTIDTMLVARNENQNWKWNKVNWKRGKTLSFNLRSNVSIIFLINIRVFWAFEMIFLKTLNYSKQIMTRTINARTENW